MLTGQKTHPSSQQAVSFLQDVQNMHSMVEVLMKTKHYQQLGTDGIFAIVNKAKSLNINPLEALNGGLYFVQGRVEMSAQMMNQLIRMRGHSIQKDSKSTKQLCILHGKRADNGDAWTVTFGIEDAQRAGLYRQNSPWTKFPEAMCFARALSMLARQLFPDVIQGCYVEGEIENFSNNQIADSTSATSVITYEQVEELEALIADDNEYKARLLTFFKIENFSQLLSSQLDRVLAAIKKHSEKSIDKKIISFPENIKEQNQSMEA